MSLPNVNPDYDSDKETNAKNTKADPQETGLHPKEVLRQPQPDEPRQRSHRTGDVQKPAGENLTDHAHEFMQRQIGEATISICFLLVVFIITTFFMH